MNRLTRLFIARTVILDEYVRDFDKTECFITFIRHVPPMKPQGLPEKCGDKRRRKPDQNDRDSNDDGPGGGKDHKTLQ